MYYGGYGLYFLFALPALLLDSGRNLKFNPLIKSIPRFAPAMD